MDQSLAVLSAAGAVVVGGGVVTALVLRRRRRRASVPEAPGGSVGDAVRRELGATRQRFSARLAEVFESPGRTPDAIFADLEEALIALDVGPATALALCQGVRRRVGDVATRPAIEAALREEIAA